MQQHKYYIARQISKDQIYLYIRVEVTCYNVCAMKGSPACNMRSDLVGIILAYVSVPVSYTHLDVYKRQVQIMSCT